MRPRIALAAALVALPTLGGCAAAGVPVPSPVVPEVLQGEVCSEDVADALAYFARLRAMKRPELQKEAERLRAASPAEPSGEQRMQSALLLALPGGPVVDERRALALLQGERARTTQPEVRHLCQLLEALLGSALERDARLHAAAEDQKENRQRVATLERDLKQAQSRGLELEQRIFHLHRLLTREQTEGAERQRQLEELRKIESSLESRRGVPPATPAPDAPSASPTTPLPRPHEPEERQSSPGR